MEPPPIPPAAALAALLPPDVDLDAGWRHEAGAPVWHGVVWGRLGRGDLAWAHFDRIRLQSLQPWIAAERGRLLRELGDYAAAEALEWPALLKADDPVDAAMLRISLAADSVGLGDVPRAERRLIAARDAVHHLDDSPRAARQRLRLAWVAVEVAFLLGQPPRPDGLPAWGPDTEAPVLPADHRWGSDFHRAKGLLFGGVVRSDLRLLDAARAIAPPALAWAVELARADLGADGAAEAADTARQRIVPPPRPASDRSSAHLGPA